MTVLYYLESNFRKMFQGNEKKLQNKNWAKGKSTWWKPEHGKNAPNKIHYNTHLQLWIPGT